MKHQIFRKIFAFLLTIGVLCCRVEQRGEGSFENFVVDPADTNIEFFWRDDKGEILRSIGNLKTFVEKGGKRLRFAMNGGMYQADNNPLGLFIENQKIVTPLNTKNEEGNFYLQPNGVFYVTTDKKAFIAISREFRNDGRVRSATQSGPMLVVGGAINPLFKENSDSVYLRNGVCVLDDGKVFFAISRKEVNFYDFAAYFQKSGCRNALYLDGYVSKMYLPEKKLTDSGGDFGVIIAVVE